MALTTAERSNIIKLVVGMFNAAPGATYLAELTVAFEANGRSLSNLAKDLALTPAYKALNPVFQTAAEFATAFLTPLGLQANAIAVDFVTAKFNAGVSKGQIAYEALVALDASTATEFADAKAIVTNKTTVAEYYSVTKAIAQTNIGTLQQSISTVTKDAASVTSAQGTIDGQAGQGGGSTLILTTALDSSVGTSGNDQILGSVSFTDAAAPVVSGTYGAGDQINGGAGTDTLSLTVDGGGATYTTGAVPAASITSVETLNLRAVQTQAADIITFNAGAVSGLTTLNSDRSTSVVTVTGLAAGATFGVIGDGAVTNGDSNFAYAATGSAKIAISNGTKAGAITNTGASAAANTITSTGAANTVGIVDLGTGTNVTDLTVDATSNLTATLAADYAATAVLTVKGAATAVSLGNVANFKTIDASGLTAGGVYIAVGTNTTSFKGGVGDDRVTTAQVATTTASTVDAGTGTADRLIVAATTDVDTSAEAKVFSGFDVLEVGNGVTATASLFTNSTITALRSSGTATINGVSAAQAGALTINGDSALTLGVTNASTVGQIDTVTVAAKYDSATAEAADGDNTLTLTAPSLVGVENVTVNVGLNATTTAFAITAMTGTLALTNLTLTGTAKSFSVTSGAAAQNVNTVVDASAVATAATLDYTDATANGVSLKGGSAADTLKGGVKSDVIAGNAGNDTITANIQATGESNTVTGGAGGDLITFTAGENTRFNFTGTDSTTAAVATPGFAAASMDTLGVTGLVLNTANFADGTTGTKFTLATGVTATAVSFSTTAVAFGTTAVTNAGDYYVHATGAGGIAYAYQDTNGNSKIDAGEFGVKLVGTNDAGWTAGEFTIASGNLVYTSIA